MVKLKGQLMSLGASGSIAKTMTYSSWKGRPYAKQFKLAEQPNTQAQLGIKMCMKFLSQAWQTLSAGHQQQWEPEAEPLNITPFDAYMREGLTRFGIGIYPGTIPNRAQGSAGLTIAFVNSAIEERYIEFTITNNGMDPIFGFYLYASDWPGDDLLPSHVEACFPEISHGAPIVLRHVPTEPFKRYYQLVGFRTVATHTLCPTELEVTWSP